MRLPILIFLAYAVFEAGYLLGWLVESRSARAGKMSSRPGNGAALL